MSKSSSKFLQLFNRYQLMKNLIQRDIWSRKELHTVTATVCGPQRFSSRLIPPCLSLILPYSASEIRFHWRFITKKPRTLVGRRHATSIVQSRVTIIPIKFFPSKLTFHSESPRFQPLGSSIERGLKNLKSRKDNWYMYHACALVNRMLCRDFSKVEPCQDIDTQSMFHNLPCCFDVRVFCLLISPWRFNLCLAFTRPLSRRQGPSWWMFSDWRFLRPYFWAPKIPPKPCSSLKVNRVFSSSTRYIRRLSWYQVPNRIVYSIAGSAPKPPEGNWQLQLRSPCGHGWHLFASDRYPDTYKCIRALEQTFERNEDAIMQCNWLDRATVLRVGSVAENYFALSTLTTNHGESWPKWFLVDNSFVGTKTKDISILWDPDSISDDNEWNLCTLVSNDPERDYPLGSWSRRSCDFDSSIEAMKEDDNSVLDADKLPGVFCEKPLPKMFRIVQPSIKSRLFFHGSRKYRFSDTKMNYTDATKACAKKGGLIVRYTGTEGPDRFAFIRYLVSLQQSNGTWIDTGFDEIFTLAHFLTNQTIHIGGPLSKSEKLHVLCEYEGGKKRSVDEDPTLSDPTLSDAEVSQSTTEGALGIGSKSQVFLAEGYTKAKVSLALTRAFLRDVMVIESAEPALTPKPESCDGPCSTIQPPNASTTFSRIEDLSLFSSFGDNHTTPTESAPSVETTTSQFSNNSASPSLPVHVKSSSRAPERTNPMEIETIPTSWASSTETPTVQTSSSPPPGSTNIKRTEMKDTDDSPNVTTINPSMVSQRERSQRFKLDWTNLTVFILIICSMVFTIMLICMFLLAAIRSCGRLRKLRHEEKGVRRASQVLNRHYGQRSDEEDAKSLTESDTLSKPELHDPPKAHITRLWKHIAGQKMGNLMMSSLAPSTLTCTI